MSSIPRRHARNVRLLLALVLSLAIGGRASAADGGLWSMTNIFACTPTPTGTACGPHLSMPSGSENGTWITGMVSVGTGTSRMWIAPSMTGQKSLDGTWTLSLGGSSVVTELRWTVGVWAPATSTFSPASGEEVEISHAGTSTQQPDEPVVVPSGARLALRLTGSSALGLPSLVDVYDELGRGSPSRLTFQAS